MSLFFIDNVANYRDYSQPEEKGEYARIFEEEYTNALNKKLSLIDTPYTKYLSKIDTKDTHKGYFSIDKKTGRVIDSKDNKETGSDDISAYDLILKNKERLLSFDEPTRFIFSHSALREGWDNPNVFQICALKPGGESAVAKRQEVGRGLRIAVNRIGDRVDLQYCKDRTTFLDVNKLTVVATDSYKDFVADIQKDIKANLADRPTKANMEYFIDKVVSDGTTNLVVDIDMANDIQSYLRFSKYLDKENHLTDKYFEDKANNTFKEMPDILAPYADSIHKLIQGIFDEKVLDEIIEDGRKPVVKENPLNDNFYKKEFQSLWNQINHKYAYTVTFDSEELINKSIMAINDKLFVSELKYTTTTGEQRKTMDELQLKQGASFGVSKTSTKAVNNATISNTKYDLIGKIKDGTKLTRKTIVRILQSIRADVFGKFSVNPEEFISKVIRLINEQKATMIVDHITYNLTDGKYDNDIFTANQAKADLEKAYKASKAIQDYVFTDGLAEKSKERKFAEDLDVANEVCVYAKLPRTFKIPTPVGDYAPDWAIAFHDNMGIKHIYFVAETKGSMESMELRGIEQAKTECVRKLFNDLRLADSVRYEVVDTYENLLNKMNTID